MNPQTLELFFYSSHAGAIQPLGDLTGAAELLG